jgi:hypothetical protein
MAPRMARIRAFWFWLGTAKSPKKTKSIQFSKFFSAAKTFGTECTGAKTPPTCRREQATDFEGELTFRPRKWREFRAIFIFKDLEPSWKRSRF